jgi:hypothetical protein
MERRLIIKIAYLAILIKNCYYFLQYYKIN